jgi:hypothetical protein
MKLVKLRYTGIFHEDIEQRGLTESSFAIPQPKTTKTIALAVDRKFGNLDIKPWVVSGQGNLCKEENFS